MHLVIISGLSGAGKTTALHSFEDAGYFTVDNLPPQLLAQFVGFCEKSGWPRGAVVVDARVRQDIALLLPAVQSLRELGNEVEIVYLDAQENTLVSRFKESRRPHPLYTAEPWAPGQGIQEAVQKERELLQEIRAAADRLIDTTSLSPMALRHQLQEDYGKEQQTGMHITVLSFGYKYGVPIDADLVFDVRFLCNPHYVPELQEHDGRDTIVREFVFSDPRTAPFLERMESLVDYAIPHYEAEGKAYLTIAIGCTGGKHRSVVLAECLAAHLRCLRERVAVRHRDIPQGEPSR